jgi:lipopolysaccharide export system protein LptA
MPHPDARLKLTPATRLALLLVALLALGLLASSSALALETDRQQPLLINADASDGTLGDGRATLRGNVEIRQGTLLVKADQADVEKSEGKVREVLLLGHPVLLQQEIENEGLVTATANSITYQVATGIVTLTGDADVDHPQYQISGELLVYDMNLQHFQGSGGDNNGRIRIQLEPEVIAPLESGLPEDEPPASESEPGDSPDRDNNAPH